ncbi:hypothetical protein ACQZV8_06975 [Magnetococcales bacterium HHB-1]
MPMSFTETEALLIDVCTIDEAEQLFEWLLKHPDGALNLGQCEHIHTAILQILMALRPRVVMAPKNAFLSQPVFAEMFWPDLNGETSISDDIVQESHQEKMIKALSSYHEVLKKKMTEKTGETRGP